MKKTLEFFIEKAKSIHGNKYDYSQSQYVNSHTPLKIICPEHGEFLQRPDNHYLGKGCPLCGNKRVSKKMVKTQEQFIKEAIEIHGDKYDYSQVKYVDSWTPVAIICPKHGLFYQKPIQHINHKAGCIKCAHEHLSTIHALTKEEFIKRARSVHGDKYDYSKVEYVNQKIPITITCPVHGDFEQVPLVHYNMGCGCPKCTLKSQTKVFEQLCSEFPNENILFEVGSHSVPWIGGQRLDIYFPDYNIAIEYDGKQHFIPVEQFGGEIGLEETIERDKRKEELCSNNNCKLFRLKYDYTEDDFKKLISDIKNLISI